MKHTMKTLLSVLLALTMICGLLPGMRLTAYATTVTDVNNLFENLYNLMRQKYEGGDMRAYIDLSGAYADLERAYFSGDGSVTPDVEAAYNSALAVYQQYGGGGHTHSWNYQASSASVTATCTGNGDCDYKNNGVTLTISAPANLECDGSAKAAAISGEIPGGSGLPDPSNITYNPGGSTAPTEPGDYTASFTWGGANASVNFTLTAPAHTHSFTYSADGATITATCGEAGCGLTSNPTLTLVAPTLTYVGQTGDGISASATLTGLADFKAATGLSVSADDIKYVGRDGTTYAESATAPTKAGKYTAKLTLSGVKTAEGEDKSVTASVEYSIKYTVTFETNGGTPIPEQQLVEAGGYATRPKTDPEKEGSVFGDWYADASFNRKYGFYEEVMENTTVYAKFGEHRVSWVIYTGANQGSYMLSDVFTGPVPAADSDNRVNQVKTFLEQDLPEGAVFTDWTTETDASGNVTYTVRPLCPVTLHANDGTINTGNVTSYICGTGATLPTDVTRAKYDFGGWFDNSEFTGTAVTQISTTDSGSKEYWAKWTPVYAVAATVTANNRTYDGTEQPLVTVTGTPTGGTMQYVLGTDATTAPTTGWGADIPTATDAGTYYVWYKAVGDENHNDSEPKAVTVVIAAQDTYTVTVTNDGHGTGAADPASGVTGTEVTLTNTPAEGYQFKEWQVVSGDVTVTDNKFKIGTANVEVKAIFEALPPDVYTVTVTDDGHGTGAANPASGATGTEVTLTNTPAAGYQFKEWQVISGGVTVADNKFTIGTANVEVKAVFEALPEGSETGITQTVSGAPAITGSNMAEVVQSVVEAIQNGTLKDVPDNVKQAVSQPGAQVTLTLISKPLADGDVPAADKTALNEAVQANGYDGYQPFDLTLQLTVTDPATGKKVSAVIHVSSKEVTFSLEVPENMRKQGRTFFLLHVSGGKVDELKSTTGNVLEGNSKDFSTYAIAYRDAAEPVKSTFYFRKVWEGSTEKSIDFTLYSADGKVVHQGFDKRILNAKEWSYSAVFKDAGSCYIIEKPIPGYITRYVNVGEYAGITDRCCNGGTIINKKIPKTGDETPLLLWAGMLLTGAAGLTVALTVNKRRKAHK